MKGGGGAEISLVGKAPGSNNDRLNMNSAMFFRTLTTVGGFRMS